MRIMMVGYGKMGRMIEAAAKARGHEVASIVDPFMPEAAFREPSPEAAKGIDVAIEFSVPSAVVSNIDKILPLGLPLVVGTTGWTGEVERVRKAVDFHDGALVYGPNFSIGVNVFYRIVAEAARLMDGFPQYDVGGFEAHHAQKTDSPSGTAKAIASILLERLDRKNKLHGGAYEDGKPAPDELHFASLRTGSIPGTHTVFFDSVADTIELTHRARSREGFAAGAVLAAEWLVSGKKKKGMFRVEEIYDEM